MHAQSGVFQGGDNRTGDYSRGRRRLRLLSLTGFLSVSILGWQSSRLLPDHMTKVLAHPRCSTLSAADDDGSFEIVGARRYGSSGRAIMGYHEEAEMTDVLIRDVPDDVIAALDTNAARLGLSRSEYVRRRLAQDAATPGSPVTVADLARFAGTFGDLADPDVMSRAWR